MVEAVDDNTAAIKSSADSITTAVNNSADTTSTAINNAAEHISGTIVSEGPYLGPFEYSIGVQEITAAIATLDAAIATVDTTLVGGFSANAAAIAAAATAITSTVIAEANNTRGLLSKLRGIVTMPPGVEVTLFRFSTNTRIQISRVSDGPSFDNNVYYSLPFLANFGSNIIATFTPLRNDTYSLAGPRYYELVYFTIGNNPPALAVFLP